MGEGVNSSVLGGRKGRESLEDQLVSQPETKRYINATGPTHLFLKGKGGPGRDRVWNSPRKIDF